MPMIDEEKASKYLARATKDGIALGQEILTIMGDRKLPLGSMAIALRVIEHSIESQPGVYWTECKEIADDVFKKLLENDLIPKAHTVASGSAYEEEN